MKIPTDAITNKDIRFNPNASATVVVDIVLIYIAICVCVDDRLLTSYAYVYE